MLKKALIVSIAANALLAAACILMHYEKKHERDDLVRAAMQGDAAHIKIHERSLAAIEGAKETAETAVLLRRIIAAGRANIDARDRVGLGR